MKEFPKDSGGKGRPASHEAGAGSPPVLAALYRGLVVLAVLIALALLTGSVWAIFLRQGNAGGGAVSGGGGNASEREQGSGSGVFSGVGRLRLSAADSVTVILSVSFPYPEDDRAFSEELASRVGSFRAATEEYFKRYSSGELKNKDEEELKAELLEKYNSLLRLGKIGTLYFNDFMIIE